MKDSFKRGMGKSKRLWYSTFTIEAHYTWLKKKSCKLKNYKIKKKVVIPHYFSYFFVGKKIDFLLKEI